MVDVRNELNSAIERLSSLLEEKERIEIEIAKQRKKVAAWQELCAADSDNDTPSAIAYLAELLDLGGLSEAIKTVLRSSKKTWMLVSEIQEELKALGFPLDKYKAPYASIATTVNRMAEPGGEVVADRNASPGARQYKWVGPSAVSRFSEATRNKHKPLPINTTAESVILAEIAKANEKLKKD